MSIFIKPKKVKLFIYSEKATKFWEVFILLLLYLVPVKSKISLNFVTFSEYMNFNFLYYEMKQTLYVNLISIFISKL